MKLQFIFFNLFAVLVSNSIAYSQELKIGNNQSEILASSIRKIAEEVPIQATSVLNSDTIFFDFSALATTNFPEKWNNYNLEYRNFKSGYLRDGCYQVIMLDTIKYFESEIFVYFDLVKFTVFNGKIATTINPTNGIIIDFLIDESSQLITINKFYIENN